MPYDEEELEGLSEEERAALEDEEDTSVDDLEDDDPDDDLEDDQDDDPEEDQDDDDADADNDQDADDEEVTEPTPQSEFTPQYKADPVENFDARMKELTDRKRDLRNQYQDGDLGLDEYEEQRDAVEEEALKLREANLKYEMSQEQTAQTAAQRWQWEQDRFFGVGANKVYLNDPMIGSAFDAAVKSLAAGDVNNDKSMSWFLEEADRMTRERFNVPGEKDDERDSKPSVKVNRRKKSDRSKIPPNLGDLPAADVPETGGDEFSKLDGLEGMALEQALAKMSQSEQERYLKG